MIVVRVLSSEESKVPITEYAAPEARHTVDVVISPMLPHARSVPFGRAARVKRRTLPSGRFTVLVAAGGVSGSGVAAPPRCPCDPQPPARTARTAKDATISAVPRRPLTELLSANELLRLTGSALRNGP